MTGPATSLVPHIVQKAHDVWHELRFFTHDRSHWYWVVTPQVLDQLRTYPWDVADHQPVPDREHWTLFGIPIRPATEPMNHNQIELRIRR